ncbi:hypothetical protein, partial [Hypericibacter sp.]|uniref:hypothetical protein n=1 Tax=Hypericibacter sp. TaxID=2705401 RepID=UPI003D6C72B8
MTGRFATEVQLAAFAAALSGDHITDAERAIIGDRLPTVTASERRELSANLARGIDRLGDAFATLRSSELRRKNGATYTPSVVVNAMTEWALHQKIDPKRIVDAGAGSGRYSIAAARAFPNATIVAIENDPLAALVLRANATLFGITERI